MSDAVWWWVMTGVAVAVELVTGTFYLLMIAIGLAAAAIAGHLGLDFAGQLIVAGVVGGAAVAACYALRRKRPAGAPAQSNKDVNLDIGETVHVEQWAGDGTASVKFRGAAWSVVWHSDAGPPPTGPGTYRIREIIGNRLILEK